MTNSDPRLLSVQGEDDIPAAYRNTPVADLLGYHNWNAPGRTYDHADLLVGMCMDHRKRLRMPLNFAYVMRSAGANFQGVELQASFAVAVGGVRAIALIGHDQCGMSTLVQNREAVVAGLAKRGGWEVAAAEKHFDEHATRFDIGDSVDFTRMQAERFRQLYSTMPVAPLLYRLDDNMLYVIDEPAT